MIDELFYKVIFNFYIKNNKILKSVWRERIFFRNICMVENGFRRFLDWIEWYFGRWRMVMDVNLNSCLIY